MEAGEFEGLEDLSLHVILRKLDSKDTARIGCVSKRFKLLASEDSVWSHYCFQDLSLTTPIDSSYNLCASFKEAYDSWRDAFSMYPWPLVIRVKQLWDRLRSWLKVNCPGADATLNKGATESEIREFERAMNVQLPLPTRVLYRFFNGQGLNYETVSPKGTGSSHTSSSVATCGLIGGYTFYDHSVDVYLLPLKEVTHLSNRINRHLGTSGLKSNIVVASSKADSHKYFFLNCTNGQLYVGTKNLLIDGEKTPCVPTPLISVHGSANEQQDALLLWLEEHCRRLENGIISYRKEDNISKICQFPEKSPLCSTAVTNGVKIRASATFVPELSDRVDNGKILFSYSIRMSLLPEGCTVSGVNFDSCQLYWRHWVIRANDSVVSDVNAEAVIGQYPLLLPAESEFAYESCTPLSSSTGSIEGSFSFVPGRLAQPKGSEFEVIVAPFPLRVPEYIF